MSLCICYILEHRGHPCVGGMELGPDSECEKRDREPLDSWPWLTTASSSPGAHALKLNLGVE